MKKLAPHILTVLFAACIWGFFVADLLLPDRAFSDLENRPLAQSPAISARSLISNTYTLKYEEYVNDQFVGRDRWITVKSLGESALGKLSNNGVVYGGEGQLFEEAIALDDAQLTRNMGFIRDFARRYEGSPIILTVVPNSYAVLEDRLPAGFPAIDQQGIIETWYRELSAEPLEVCDVLPALRAGAGDYIYYRTDHHWTTLGAELACRELADHLGRERMELAALEAHEVPQFYGTYYSKAKNWNALPDVITWYDVPVRSVTIDGAAADGLYDHEMWDQRDKYAAFLRGNNGLTVIESDTPGARGRILIFKDSYGNCLAPLLTRSFSEIHVVDLRYYNDVASLMGENQYDAIWVLYNFSTLTTDQNLFKLVS